MNHLGDCRDLRIAIVGGGWAGMAAAHHLVQHGARVCVFEAAPSLGGRARGVWVSAQSLRKNWPENKGLPDLPKGWQLDSGQHILIGAYTQSLALMANCGVPIEHADDAALRRVPLALVDAAGRGLQVRRTHATALDVFAAIVRARGWSWRDRTALLRWLLRWRLAGFRCGADWVLSQICEGLPQTVQRQFIAPLCESALNLPPERASAALFLRVMADGLLGAGASDLLLPRRDLAALLPEPVAAWLFARGQPTYCGARVAAVVKTSHGWRVELDKNVRPLRLSFEKNQSENNVLDEIPAQDFSHVLLATNASGAARLVQPIAPDWAAQAHALPHTAIATVYAYTSGLKTPENASNCPEPRAKEMPFGAEVETQPGHCRVSALTLPQPMVALSAGPAQFAFDRAHTHGEPQAGVVALVASNCGHYENIQQLSHDAIIQAREQLNLPDLVEIKTLMDKRAAFSAEPHIIRPPMQISEKDGIWACGDYVDGIYPATLEGAVRSGKMAAQAILESGL